MKACMVWGDLSSDRTSEQYPTVTVCDACVTSQMAAENSQIVNVVGKYDPDYGEQCFFCDKDKDEEDAQF